jgi:hypothetical protein
MTEAPVEDRRGSQPVPSAERRQHVTPLHFRRIELKYVLPQAVVPELVARMSPYVDWDPFLANGGSSYPVTSLYFDSYDFHSLFAKEAGWLARRRIRLRTYSERFTLGNTAFFEIKRRHDFLVSKDRLPLTLTEDATAPGVTLRRLLRLTRDGSQTAVDEAKSMAAWYNLRPAALVSYDRVAFVSRNDPELRITIDRDLRGSWRPLGLGGSAPYQRCGIHPVLPRLMAYGAHQAQGPHPLSATRHVVVELKFAHGIPRWLHDIIAGMNLARSAYSKYGSVVRTLQPNLFEAFGD